MEAYRNGTPMIASSGYVAVVDEDLCAGCGECADLCQFAAISVENGYAVVDYEACMGCGVCVAHCPQEAVSLERDPAKGEPLEIRRLLPAPPKPRKTEKASTSAIETGQETRCLFGRGDPPASPGAVKRAAMSGDDAQPGLPSTWGMRAIQLLG